ncbi:crossover junction endonuclease EME1 [Thrips palmi]|uniref:Crossover junction endonuclease EME1 n=1 Tax=Thrips palmi TaxID=161013 RepID=A0A6P8YC21_THRPL|nr:crossover junction endonuclease EME1 [Thrips palmi]
MDQVIVLSSSDEDECISDAPSASQKIEQDSSLLPQVDCDDFDNFDYGILDRDEVLCLPSKNNSSSGYSPYLGGQRDKVRKAHDLSDSDDEENVNKQSNTNESSDDELPDLDIDLGPSTSAAKKDGKSAELNLRACEETLPESKLGRQQKREENKQLKQLERAEKANQRQALRQEREQKKKEAAHAKALKQATAEVGRSKKPGECLKWVTCILDPGLLKADYSGELLTALRTCEIEYKVEDCLIPNSVTWERRIQNVTVDDDMTVQRAITIQNEPLVLVVWMWNKIVEEIHSNQLLPSVEEILSLLPGRDLTIAIYGLEDYFKFQKTQKRRDIRSDVLGTGPSKKKAKEGTFEAAPTVSRGDVEYALAEVQIKWGISHRCINSKIDMANLVCQLTKAIAEAPFKQEKHKKDADRLDWYALGDSKDCVVVDKEGNGSLQLWQRQLCQFPLASRETSEAIASVYPSPISLLQAYERCSKEEEAQLLLEDIPVRRGPGPLSTARRIGPQLSKKIHTFFTTFDENSLIAPD